MSRVVDLPDTNVRTRTDGGSVLVMESGSPWPLWVPPTDVSSLILQGPNEQPTEFASRAISAIAQIHAARGVLRRLVLCAGSRIGDETFTARCLVCRAAAACMPQRKPAQIVFTGHPDLPPEARHELVGLAGALALELVGCRIEIRVKLADGREEEGRHVG